MSAGELFAGALIPGLILVGFYIIYQVIIAVLKPSSSPAIPREEGEALDAAFYGRLFLALAPPMVLIVAVLGSILAGIATPTEAASVGAIGAIFLGAARLGGKTRLTVILSLAALVGLLVIAATMDLRMSRAVVPDADRMAYFGAALLTILFTIGLGWALLQTHRIGVLGEVMRSTVRISTMIYAILIGAALFSLVFRGLGGDDAIEGMLHGLPGGQWTAILLVMVLMFILGFFLDFIEITFVVVPVVAPALLAMDGTYGPIWLGVLIAMNLQTSFLTPPFGFALFYLRGVVPESVPTIAIYKGVIPFVIIQLLALLLIALEPELVTWLPSKLF